MALIDQLYGRLAQGPTPECDEALGEALECAEPAYFEQLCAVLEQRAFPASWAALVRAYDRLPDTLRNALTSDPERLRVAVAEAAKLPSEHARLMALQVLSEHPLPQLAFVLSDLIADRSARVRETAAILLRRQAADFLTKHGPVPPAPDEEATELVLARRKLVHALGDAARSFERHWRPEALEAALWFARDLGDDLWRLLEDGRARAPSAVAKQLAHWDHPRLAGFYLTALMHESWRRMVAKPLRSWCDKARVVALMQHSDLLDYAPMRDELANLKAPAWFSKADEFVLDMPARARAEAPRWVCAIGLTDAERTALLSRWVHRPCPYLRRSSVYAIASLELTELRRRLEEVAIGDDGVAAFARWWLRGADSGLVPGRRRGMSERKKVEDAAFAVFWELCRVSDARTMTRLLSVLRENLRLWEFELLARLRSSDARDRLMALHALSTDELAVYFKHDLQALLSDSVPAIRDLARVLLKTVGRLEADGEGHSWLVNGPSFRQPPAEVEARPVEEVRADLLRSLTSLLESTATSKLTPEAIDAVGILVRRYRAARETPREHVAAEGLW